jgi:hypothetical protein
MQPWQSTTCAIVTAVPPSSIISIICATLIAPLGLSFRIMELLALFALIFVLLARFHRQIA